MFEEFILVNAQYNEHAYRLLFLLGDSLIKQSSSEMAFLNYLRGSSMRWFWHTHTHTDNAFDAVTSTYGRAETWIGQTFVVAPPPLQFDNKQTCCEANWPLPGSTVSTVWFVPFLSRIYFYWIWQSIHSPLFSYNWSALTFFKCGQKLLWTRRTLLRLLFDWCRDVCCRARQWHSSILKHFRGHSFARSVAFLTGHTLCFAFFLHFL